MRSMEMSAKTVEDAVQAACDALGKLRERYNAQKKAMDAAKQPAGTQTE